MKYMILLYGSQRDYDRLAGAPVDEEDWSAEQVAAMYEFMAAWNQELVESGEFVDARGLAAPAQTRRVHGLKDGVPVVTEGPFAETEEVLAGYTIVECASVDRAVEIAAKVTKSPNPGFDQGMYVDVRPVLEGAGDLGGDPEA